MTMIHALRAGSALSLALVIAMPAMLSAQSSDETATYLISAETDAGIAAAVPGGGTSHRLGLQLGSSRSAPQPEAEHFVPENLGVGASVPLIAPERDHAHSVGESNGFIPEAKGKIRVMWGCGETVKPENVRVIDLANPTAGGFSGLQIQAAQDLASRGFAGYGEWPNARHSRSVPNRGSLVGAHRVSANYAPEFAFDMASQHDFLDPLSLSQAEMPGGATKIDWQGLNRATGYFLAVFGTEPDGTVVMWTSSDVAMQDSAMGQYLPPSEVARLVAAKALLPAEARTCTVPTEVTSAVETPMLMMTAYADDADFAQPRPADAPANWQPDWTVKVRYKSGSMMMLGEAGRAMAELQSGAFSSDEAEEEAPAAPPPKRKRRGLLGTIIDQALPN